MKPAGARSVEELRNARRFSLTGGARAELNSLEARIDDVSDGGLRIEHAQPVKIGGEVTVRLTILALSETAVFNATVVWSRMSNGAHSKLRYLSGLRFDPTVEIAGFLGRAIRSSGKAQTDSLEKKRQKLEARMRAQHTVVSAGVDRRTEVFQRIERAWNDLMSDPTEAAKWYLRAKFAPVQVVRSVNALAYRDDVLATWEYLLRNVTVEDVSAVIGRIRGAR